MNCFFSKFIKILLFFLNFDKFLLLQRVGLKKSIRFLKHRLKTRFILYIYIMMIMTTEVHSNNPVTFEI